jgi:hypothetical protein
VVFVSHAEAESPSAGVTVCEALSGEWLAASDSGRIFRMSIEDGKGFVASTNATVDFDDWDGVTVFRISEFGCDESRLRVVAEYSSLPRLILEGQPNPYLLRFRLTRDPDAMGDWPPMLSFVRPEVWSDAWDRLRSRGHQE